jgi:hypothetical protein
LAGWLRELPHPTEKSPLAAQAAELFRERIVRFSKAGTASLGGARDAGRVREQGQGSHSALTGTVGHTASAHNVMIESSPSTKAGGKLSKAFDECEPMPTPTS